MKQTKPNILLITSDQQHYSTLGFKNDRIKTPNLDRLARGGVDFTRAYCPNPLCTPTRSSIITGQYPSSHGAWTLGTKLDESVPTVGELLQKYGYATTLVGKAHFQPLASTEEYESLECQPTLQNLDFWKDFQGPWYGFEHIEIARNHADESHVGQHYAIWMEEQGFTNWQDFYQKWPRDPDEPKRELSWDLPQEYHYTHWTGERTIANIERHVDDNKPFFLWSSFHDPHPPYLVPEPWASMYDPADMQPGELVDGELDNMPPQYSMTQQPDNDKFAVYREHNAWNHGFHTHLHDREHLKKQMAVYYGMVSFMDHEIGRILDKLDELGIADNTLVVFTTDHGHYLGQHGLIAKGAFHYEDLVKVPFIARVPGMANKGGNCTAIQSLVDLSPTFLSAAGIDVPMAMQGINQLGVWRGEASSARDHAIVENRHQLTAIHLRTFVTERYKMTVYRDQPYGELFDLLEDPNETHNRWDDKQYKSIKDNLMQQFLNAEIRREVAPMPRIAGA